MRIADAVDLDELRRRAGCGDRLIGEPAGALAERRIGAADFDAPSGPVRRRIADDDVTPGFDERPGNGVIAHGAQGLLQNVSLGDAAKIEPHALTPESHCATPGIEGQLLPARQRARGRKRGGIGHPSGAARVTPEGDERPDGRIEHPAAGASDLGGARQDAEELRADGRPVACMPFEPSQLAVGAVVAHHLVQRRDAAECGPRGLAGLVLRLRVKYDPDRKAHVHFGELGLERLTRLEGSAGCREPQDE